MEWQPRRNTHNTPPPRSMVTQPSSTPDTMHNSRQLQLVRKKFGSSLPAFSMTTKQIDYESVSGDYYSLLMSSNRVVGRSFSTCPTKPTTSQGGIDLINKLNMGQ